MSKSNCRFCIFSFDYSFPHDNAQKSYHLHKIRKEGYLCGVFMSVILSMKDVNFAYHSEEGEIPALENISLDVEEGEFVAVIGPSGCGKSTLLSLISGLNEPEHGSVILHNRHATQTNIGYMLQKDHLFEWRTIYRNVILGPEINKCLTREKEDKIHQMLNTYGLSDFKNKRPSELSGGMRQRAALIRTLAMEPDLLLLDEPFSALDYQTRISVADDIGMIIKQEGKTAILVTHDLSEAISLADRVIVLTKRPATIKSIIPIQLSIPNRTPFLSRTAPEFKDYFNLLWKELGSNE